MNGIPKVGELLEVDAIGIDDRGQGLAKLEAGADERALLVPGLFPGERASVRIEALARHAPRAHGRVNELLRASPSRREPPCSRHEQHQRAPGDRRPKPSCGGCPLMGLNLDAQREAKRAWILREYGLELEGSGGIIGGAEFDYRWSSKRVVGGEPGRLRLGSRAAGKRRGDHIADMRGCLVDHPRIRDGFDALELQANELGIEPWREAGGDLRYVWAKTNGAQLLLTLICGAEPSRAARELGPRLHELGIADGIAWSVQSSSGNAIRGGAPQVIAGLAQLDLDAGLELGPLGFLQPNPEVAALAYRDLVALPDGQPMPPGELAFDLYAGAGVTTRLLRERFERVIPCESYPESAARLGIEPQTVEDFARAWLDAASPTPALIVANPPRAGLGESVCAALRELAAPRVHLMSCSPQTLAADLDRLRPDYQLIALRGYDTLPHTAHLELVAWLSRRPQTTRA
ncbi:23S rRNA (Uracil-5-) -methyltransferase rumB [Enhygromyxa salina]|uniref:23S rRNA (Uracil-5-)-methyltransferase rumB n=1 Tax=Enhygromyxa salina TaxID=215803 RepID=A0A0C1ZNI1_9BACT|nr:class I SAM-dependent RNA methyltransferase [Enhygromyxa salina]KIG12633.1 23S rRNA (Uracil-5-) -methyltransferase rumB [Enhygromyxa salina]